MSQSTSVRRRTTRALAAVAAGALVLAPAVPAFASSGTATVSVLHAVPDTAVDVYANGDELIPDFQPGTLTDPLELPAGSYDLAVYPAGADISTTEPVISADDVEVPAGANVSVAAHLDAAGTPVLTPFVNDTSAVDAGDGRLTVRHTAAAPAVDVLADGTAVVEDLENPDEASLETAAGTVSAAVNLAGTETTAIGPTDLTIAEGASTIVYAWGSAEAGNLQLAVQTIDDLGSDPSGVPSGLGDDSTGLPLPLVLVVGLAAGGAVLLTVRRTRQRA